MSLFRLQLPPLDPDQVARPVLLAVYHATYQGRCDPGGSNEGLVSLNPSAASGENRVFFPSADQYASKLDSNNKEYN